MKSFTLRPGHYVIADACVVKDEYYFDFLLPAFETLSHGESVQAGSSVILCTGADGLYDVTHKTTGEVLFTVPVDAANVAVVPAKMVPGGHPHGLDIVLTEETEVACYHDAMVIGDDFRVRIGKW